MTPDSVIEQAAKVLHDMNGCGDPYGTCISTSEYYRGEARALADAGLLHTAQDDLDLGDAERIKAERDELRATVEHITELAFEHNGCSGCQTPWWLRQALGSGFTPSLTPSLAEQVEALTTRAERAEAEVARLREGAAGLAADWRRETESQYLIAASDLDELVNDPEPKQALAMAVAELRAMLDRVRALHRRHECTGYPDCTFLFGGVCAHDGHCRQCRWPYPCPTIVALDGGEQR